MAHRGYKRWTDEEIAEVKAGRVPKGRTYAQAAAWAYNHGSKWSDLKKEDTWHWSGAEKRMLSEGRIPPGRSECAGIQAARIFGIKYRPAKLSRAELQEAVSGKSPVSARELGKQCRAAGIPMRVQSIPKACSRRWRAEALAAGKTYRRKQFLRGPMAREESAWLMHQCGLSFAEIGRKLGVTGARVQQMVSDYEALPA